MIRWLIRRLLYSIVVAALALVIVFTLGHAIGDPARLMLETGATEEMYEALRKQLGLDDPLIVQFARTASGWIRGDFGDSLFLRVPALPLVLQRLPATLILTAVAMVVAGVAGVAAGMASALRPGRPLDRFLSVLSVAAISTPAFWLALVLILVFAQTLRLLPSAGATGPLNLILPAATVAFAAFGMIAQVSRSALIGQLELPYTLTARAKGLSRPQVLARHTARNSAIPVLTVFGSEIASLVNGAVVVEVIFGWPGIGNLFITAIRHRDLPLIEACVFVTSVLVILINLIIDIAYFRIDPRIRTQPGIRPRPTVTASIRQAQTPTTP